MSNSINLVQALLTGVKILLTAFSSPVTDLLHTGRRYTLGILLIDRREHEWSGCVRVVEDIGTGVYGSIFMRTRLELSRSFGRIYETGDRKEMSTCQQRPQALPHNFGPRAAFR